jgi:hypothetical protein
MQHARHKLFVSWLIHMYNYGCFNFFEHMYTWDVILVVRVVGRLREFRKNITSNAPLLHDHKRDNIISSLKIFRHVNGSFFLKIINFSYS